MTDDELEAKIREAEQRCLLEAPEYVEAWRSLVALIGQRSPVKEQESPPA